jgi:hypothetical protein
VAQVQVVAQQQGCYSVPSVIVILILIISILIAAAVAILVGELHDELIARLNHSIHLGLLLPQPPAQSLQLCDLLAGFLIMLSK